MFSLLQRRTKQSRSYLDKFQFVEVGISHTNTPISHTITPISHTITPISYTITPISYTITPISHTISESVEMGVLL